MIVVLISFGNKLFFVEEKWVGYFIVFNFDISKNLGKDFKVWEKLILKKDIWNCYDKKKLCLVFFLFGFVLL